MACMRSILQKDTSGFLASYRNPSHTLRLRSVVLLIVHETLRPVLYIELKVGRLIQGVCCVEGPVFTDTVFFWCAGCSVLLYPHFDSLSQTLDTVIKQLTACWEGC